VSSKYDCRDDKAVVRNYGALLIEFASVVPDGIVCFFTSYVFMENIIQMWHEMQVISKVLDKKLVFMETPDIVESSIALENYRKACDSGRGAVFLSVARGKVAVRWSLERLSPSKSAILSSLRGIYIHRKGSILTGTTAGVSL